MYRQYEPEQEDNVQMQDQQPNDMYDQMNYDYDHNYEDAQYMQGGRPMYCYPMPMPYQGDMYQPMYNWQEPDMSRQMGMYGRPGRRPRRRRRPYHFYFYMPPFYYHYGYPRPNYWHDDYDDEYDHDHDYEWDNWD